jgi:hypothetical protein
VFGAVALAQSADITGWHGLLWGAKKAAALKTLQPLHVRECGPHPKAPCAEAAGPDELAIDAFRLNAISYQVGLFFSPATGLTGVTMTAHDEKGAFDKALAGLTSLHGKPEFQSEYDGDAEEIQSRWIWTKPHGKISLASEDGVFTITYEARSERGRK